jgi:hypothetical protein
MEHQLVASKVPLLAALLVALKAGVSAEPTAVSTAHLSAALMDDPTVVLTAEPLVPLLAVSKAVR